MKIQCFLSAFPYLERAQEAGDENFKLLCVLLLRLNHTEDETEKEKLTIRKTEKVKSKTIWKFSIGKVQPHERQD